MLAKIMSFLQLAAEKKNMTNKNSTLFISLGLYFELLLVLSSVQNSDFKSQFIMSKITQIILHISFIEEYQSRTTFFENFHFLKQFITKNESNFRRLRSMLFEVVCIKKMLLNLLIHLYLHCLRSLSCSATTLDTLMGDLGHSNKAKILFFRLCTYKDKYKYNTLRIFFWLLLGTTNYNSFPFHCK